MRSSPKGFWSALETVPGLSAVDAEWRSRFGDEYKSAKSFLRPSGKLASSHPCTERRPCECAHAVVEHGSGDIVAVCRCGRGCTTFPLNRSEIAVYELDRTAFDQALASAFNLMEEPDSTPGLHQTTRLGAYSPYAGFRFPVYLTIQLEPDNFDSIATSLVSRTNQPFVLLAPTRDHCMSRTEQVLANRKSAFVPMAEDIALVGRRELRLCRPLDDILASFRTDHLPAPEDDGSMIFFPTPPDATWSDVSIRFVDNHTVSIKVKSETRKLHYAQMGMANKRSSNPTNPWKLLEGFADPPCGEIDWHSRHAALNVKKQKQELSKRLREFFRIEDDPIEWVKDTPSYYRCKFRILSIGGDEY